MRVIASPTGTGKTTAAAKHMATVGTGIWLADRHADIDAAVEAIERAGGVVGRVLPLRGQTKGVKHCLHPDTIEIWQDKGYSYRRGYCQGCEREADPEQCCYLASIDALDDAPIIAVTKAFARTKKFFDSRGNPKRKLVVIDEDPIGLMRPPVVVSREDLAHYLQTIGALIDRYGRKGDNPAHVVARHYQRLAQWCWDQMTVRQTPEGSEPRGPSAGHEPIDIPRGLPTLKSGLPPKTVRLGRRTVERDFHAMMRANPRNTVRNVTRDLRDLSRAAAKTVFVTAGEVLWHIAIRIPPTKSVVVLDATASVNLLRPIFTPRAVDVLCDHRVQPAGRVIQLMDANGPRSYLNRIPPPPKLVRIIDAIGDRHPQDKLVLISHLSCVERLQQSSRHKERIIRAQYGAIRGRNDLESSSKQRIACHIVIGSPKTTEEDRRRLALAVYGRSILPFVNLVDRRQAVVGAIPDELVEGEQRRERAWEVRTKGYLDLRMQAVYEHTVVAELTHAADRARVMLHHDAAVYLITNEPCPRLWFAEMCYAADLLELGGDRRADFAGNYESYETAARKLLDAGKCVGNADVCRALDRKPSWGLRYWQEFVQRYRDCLEGKRKMRWRPE